MVQFKTTEMCWSVVVKWYDCTYNPNPTLHYEEVWVTGPTTCACVKDADKLY